MSQYSELIGSFIRTGNYPLEANYIFDSEQSLRDFYTDELNNTTLHKGLFKIVSTEDKQTLYWVIDVDGELTLTPLISGNSINELNNKIQELEDSKNLIIDRAFYSRDSEEIILIFKTSDTDQKEVRIPVSELIEEWDISNPSNSVVILNKARNIQGVDLLSADIKVSEQENNKLIKAEDGLYVNSSEVDIEYQDGNLKLLTNGQESKIIPLVDKVMVEPTLNVTWEIFNQDGTTSPINASTRNLTLENGYKVNGTFNFKWIHDSSKKDPTSTNGVCGTILPVSGKNSENHIVNNIVTSQTFTQNLVSPKSGFMVSGSNIIAATGNDITSSTISVSFQHRVYYGITNSSVPNISDLANNKLQNTKAITLPNITANNTQYWAYAYPKSLGVLSKITQNGASPVLEDFNRTEQTIVNQAGLSIDYYVYTSKNRGAFTNVELKFE